MSTQESYTSSLQIEHRSIDQIPAAERHGTPNRLFFIWFGANMQVTAAATGAIAVAIGLSLPWALLALLIGNLFGVTFMAAHSAQGPTLGIPQMIQSRAQFGFYGAIVPLVFVLLMYVGFFAASAILGGAALAAWWGINAKLATALVSLVCAVLAIYGYRMIHQYERWISLVCGLGFVYLTIRLLTLHHIDTVWHSGSVPYGMFLLGITLAATWQITYAPYVADYSRYLPEKTSQAATFWWTAAGSVIGSCWLMAFGAVALAVAPKLFNGGSVTFFTGLGNNHTGWLIALIIIGGIVAVNVLNLYGMFMSATTTITALHSMQVNRGARTVFVLVAAVIGTVLAIAATSNFLTNFENFILFLAYFLIPWTAINLTDFYLVRKGQYDIASIFTPDGIYDRLDWRTMVAYIVAIGVEVPFMNTTFYAGPMVSHLGGGDISWILGLIVASGLYYVLHLGVDVMPHKAHEVSTTSASSEGMVTQ
ncbi:MAG: purine-cytosine permease family protein [Acidimicrobiales bacterium]|jgi:NCS1 family nucleobase:cation symporter-1